MEAGGDRVFEEGFLSEAYKAGDGRGVLLSLGGGGVRGLAHLGVLRVLEREGVDIRGIAGVSSGAIIASAHAFGISADEEDFVDALFDPTLMALTKGGMARIKAVRRVWRVGANLYSALRRSSIFGSDPLMRGLTRLFGERRIEDSPLPLAVVAANLESGEVVTLREGRVADALYASSALPGIFPPARMRGGLLVDGGIVTKVPVEATRALSDEDLPVIGVDVSNPPGMRENHEPRTAIESALLGWEVSRRRIAEIDLTGADLAIRLHPEKPIGAFEVERSQEIVRLGEEAACKISASVHSLFARKSEASKSEPYSG